jgi:hypothetical protein
VAPHATTRGHTSSWRSSCVYKSAADSDQQASRAGGAVTPTNAPPSNPDAAMQPSSRQLVGFQVCGTRCFRVAQSECMHIWWGPRPLSGRVLLTQAEGADATLHASVTTAQLLASLAAGCYGPNGWYTPSPSVSSGSRRAAERGPSHRPREDGLAHPAAHPAETSRSNLASALGLRGGGFPNPSVDKAAAAAVGCVGTAAGCLWYVMGRRVSSGLLLRCVALWSRNGWVRVGVRVLCEWRRLGLRKSQGETSLWRS